MDLLDRYYTPTQTAESFIKLAGFSDVSSVLDPTCGKGNLLLAAHKLYKNVELIGFDIDLEAIEFLREKFKSWQLFHADILCDSSISKALLESQIPNSDLLLLNPPFSHFNRKSVSCDFKGATFKCSIAMSYLLRCIEKFKPKQGAIVIIPESVMHSHTDTFARKALQQYFSLNIISSLEKKTFKGARVHSLVISIKPHRERVTSLPTSGLSYSKLKISLTRGNLPVYKLKTVSPEQDNAIRFLHSTDLKNLYQTDEQKFTIKKKTGAISDISLLIPRVGLPKVQNIPITQKDTCYQLSDCLIAISADSRTLAIVKERLLKHWEDFFELYKGTGARYITLDRLSIFLKKISIEIIN
ncbi:MULTISPECIES: N-6 DNA methylase [unclassified Pseudoalteromonas]|uniref:N-6 DNA methylase n=1 Tax=unclassified Pseudoalteromonas TaxID=194690 RepID=UPI003329B51B